MRKIIKVYKAVALCSFACLVISAHSQQTSFKDTVQMRDFMIATMQHLTDQEYPELFDDLESRLFIDKREFDNFKHNFILQHKLILKEYGDSNGYFFIKKRELSLFAVKYYYIVKLKGNMIRIVYSFYNFDGEWKLIGYFMDDEVSSLYE